MVSDDCVADIQAQSVVEGLRGVRAVERKYPLQLIDRVLIEVDGEGAWYERDGAFSHWAKLTIYGLFKRSQNTEWRLTCVPRWFTAHPSRSPLHSVQNVP
jgi:hypothetical protein